ncbi:di-trans,poly-cis-decaprenylcistransferase [Methylobacterium sp. E-041]|jgi:undecaprenyl diphosphate synthase|uniref:di-trans,poly-cis-decaprenylcistransferase n=2 Tax=Methylobacterium TaxID=407 RepID=UPI0011C7AEC9|nr:MULTISPECIES: di-trans,poly-cis-decaprenylcistransferase [unclassified Methylobacterium]MCJ2040306.1 di-trans,poly-cis-decaprenylcistransferase [Methylobacterium sp. J-059]MCJ2075028.1 di-trans,poly-cis-decaprenylcistransferase [Methylobacterium sp. E-016]MCJ2106173.1 di-trans,poly-cis-decaprenylcistransferase [Methylobacterium sp. E-041]TXN26341.1 di-trans,poly-cis-decaprenylcistransferase [Methylobacterium sp. WL93]TXN48655.1 di-trans,poly-cis-decaprenylcistransferase [Methylobacterium sp
MQSPTDTRPGLHAAIIMDGNGRWATRRGLPRAAGHRTGVEAIRRTAEACPEHGIGTLTLYAFSSDNWQRPADEVGGLMRLLRVYLRNETARLARTGTRLSVVGRRDRLPAGLPEAIERAEAATAAGRKLHLRIAVDYSARDAILAAAARLAGQPASREAFGAEIAGAMHGSPVDVDLLIRTGGEQRLSDFMLWEAAYAELHFTERMWPDFGEADLAAAMAEFTRRDRRFGGLSAPKVSAAA